ncbi:methyltransferase domain-containing protein [uncultured Prochlorococcus sp.]|uniref:class I SAM-dependent methyltransferase n=1 Tax=uncultured Prochlorococcus sp. TaxID=159733 RepID=UPI0025866212|nr:methyltransferase domain-containing protein [uncultured Prochlorococcus sp.]
MKYFDPIRKVGSQKEIPSFTEVDNFIKVEGYQSFLINKISGKLDFLSHKKKCQKLDLIFKNINDCKSILDLGCNSGVALFIAKQNNFTFCTGVDHDPECIDILNQIVNKLNLASSINAYTLNIGDNKLKEKIKDKYDLVYCGALIHWIFSLTSDFRNFNSLISYLSYFSKNRLVIEWVDPEDSVIKKFDHISRNSLPNDEIYNIDNFERNLSNFGKIEEKITMEKETRISYICKLRKK